MIGKVPTQKVDNPFTRVELSLVVFVRKHNFVPNSQQKKGLIIII